MFKSWIEPEVPSKFCHSRIPSLLEPIYLFTSTVCVWLIPPYVYHLFTLEKSPSPLSPCLSFGPARGGRCRSSDTPAKEATDYCPGSLSRCLMPVLSDRPGEAMLGRGKPRVLTLPWNLYYIEKQQLSSRGPFGNVQSVCRWRFT